MEIAEIMEPGGLNSLSELEQAFMVNSTEHDILPGVRSDLPAHLRGLSTEDLAAKLLELVDRGWVYVCRNVPWTAPDGMQGFQPGEPIGRDALPEVLGDPRSWSYPDGSWIGAVTLVATEEGLLVTRRK